jgi:phage terminase large subunit-like protein
MPNMSTKRKSAGSRDRSGKSSIGERVVGWIERHCYVPEGKFVGHKVKLRDWQKKEILRIYDNEHGTRRAILSFGRKNGKTALAALLCLAHLAGPVHVRNSQLFSAAQSRDQAGVLFDLMVKIVRMSPTLSDVVQIRETAKTLLVQQLGTIYRALSAETSTAFGLSPVFLVHDELGQVRGPKSPLYEALETAVGAQEAPLSIIISTQAPTDGDLLSILIDDALAGHDPRTVVALYTADPKADPFAESTIRQANPAFGEFQNAAEVMAMARDASRMPSREAEYRNLILNQRVEAASPFVSKSLWQSCGAEPAPFRDHPVFGGLDLSATNDLTALVLIAQIGGIWQVRPTFWLPADGLAERSRLDRVPYDVWHKAGHLQLCPGKAVGYEFVADFIKAQFDLLKIQKLAFDEWNFKHLRPWLIAAGMSEKFIDEKFEPFRQGYKSMSPAVKGLERALLAGKIAHGNHPVLATCAFNAVVTIDPAENKKLDKAKSRGRIDGMVALAMAIGVAESAQPAAPKQYQVMVL